GLIGAGVNPTRVINTPRTQRSIRTLVQLCRSDPAQWITFQHLRFLKRQYVKASGVLSQRTRPKQEPVSSTMEERDDPVLRQIQEVAHVKPVPAVTATRPGAEPEAVRQARIEARQWKELSVNFSELPGIYARLSKIKLTALVVTTAAAGYAMAPVPFDPITFTLATVGTGLSSCMANSINQYFEVPFDSNMSRTKNRPLVRGQISILLPIYPMSLLCTCPNHLNGAFLTLSPKRPTCAVPSHSQLNSYLTPSLIFFFSTCNDTYMTHSITYASDVLLSIDTRGRDGTQNSLFGALLLGAFLYSWQFPHFNALSWNLREDYSRGGYRMMSVTHPALCRRVALRHSVSLIGLSALGPVLDVTTWTFPLVSLPINLYISYLAFRFYQHGERQSARKLFFCSLWHLPMLLLLALTCKKPRPVEEAGPPGSTDTAIAL
ncbi:protoheme IX farnesyltransferase, mitochondrial, partial [Silurus asotus]